MIPHNRPTLGKEEEDAAIRVLRSGWVAQGPEVEGFENDICAYLGLPDGHAVAVSSGTAALFLALKILNARGKKVAFPAYACSALRNACVMSGGIPLLVDNRENSPNIDLTALEKSGAEIAIVPHMFGFPVDVPQDSGISIIEDCAQALGASVGGQPVGLTGEMGIYSFYATKLMTTGGQGGMVVSKNMSLIDQIRDYREFDCRNDQRIRFNFQMTDLQAAVGREQLKKLPRFLARRQEIFDLYQRSGLNIMDETMSSFQPLKAVRFRVVLKTDEPRAIIDLLARFQTKGIVPIEEWELLGEAQLFPKARKLTRTTVSLPIYPTLTGEEVDLIISVIGKGGEK